MLTFTRELTGADVAAYLLALRADPCAFCGTPSEALDHIDPAYSGGLDDWSNRAGICRACNSSKGTRELLMHLLAVRIHEAMSPLREQARLIAGGPSGQTAIAREWIGRRAARNAARAERWGTAA